MAKRTLDQIEKETIELIAKLGLTDWGITIKTAGHADFAVLNDCIAAVQRNPADRYATIAFNPLTEITRADVVHELLELMLADFDLYFRDDVTEDIRAALRHRVIVRLEHLI
jgi:hypothetical protein